MLATVKGDVHDIGKNLVDIILTNNGYTVHNIGIKMSRSRRSSSAWERDKGGRDRHVGPAREVGERDHGREPRELNV